MYFLKWIYKFGVNVHSKRKAKKIIVLWHPKPSEVDH